MYTNTQIHIYTFTHVHYVFGSSIINAAPYLYTKFKGRDLNGEATLTLQKVEQDLNHIKYRIKERDCKMGVTVILAEKPSQAKSYISAFEVEKREKTHVYLKSCSTFPQGAIVTWGIGHLVSLKMPGEYKKEWEYWDLKNLPIIPEEFEWKVNKEKKAQFDAVKKLFKNADILINACDIDREGSNIFYSIYHMAGVKNKIIKRLWINSLEVDEIKKGFNNLQSNEKDLLMYEEAKTRQISDWLVGMNASPLYSLLLSQNGVKTKLSIGRVQSATVFMIYQRQKEIENFVPKPFYELTGSFKCDNGIYEGKAKLKKDTKEELHTYLLENNLSLKIEVNGIIRSVDKKEKRTKSPQLHSLSTLQVTANKKWKYSPSKVLEIMQKLYEKKLVTYPRSSTNYITESEFNYLINVVDDFKKLIGVEFENDLKPKSRYVDSSKVQEHYAIIPTKTVATEGVYQSLSDEEKNIYDEVIRNTLAMFHSDYIYEETKILTVVNNLEFETTGKIEINKGWKSLFSHQENENKEKDKVLPSVTKAEEVLGKLNSKEGFTTPPKLITEGDLIKLMINAGKKVEDDEEKEILKKVEGIGTEATRAGIIETIKDKGYIKVEKNVVTVTPKGIVLCESIQGTLLSSPSMTAKWETYLQKIGEGKGSRNIFISNIVKFINKLIETAPQKLASESVQTVVKAEQKSKEKGTCPACGKGSMLDKGKFIGCSEYTNGCNFSISKTIAGKKITELQLKQLIEKKKTNLIKGFKSKLNPEKTFNAYLVVKGKDVKMEYENKK